MTDSTRDMAGDSPLVALHEAVQSVARQTDLRTTLALVAEKARALTGAAAAAVTLLDKARALLDFAAVAGANAAEIVGQTVRVEDALAGQTALTGELYLAHHTAEAQPLLATLAPELALGWGVRSAAVVPIYVAGRPAGALAAINREDGGAFGGDDILRLQTLANIAALALGMDDLRRLATQKQRERDILFHAARTTSSSLNVQEVLSSVLATVEETMDMAAGAVYLLNDERTRLYISADRGLEGDDRDRQLAADAGPAAQVLAASGALRLEDSGADAADPLLPGMRSTLAAPMLSRAMPEGLIAVGSRQPDAYTAEDAALLSAVASQAAVALENAWLYEDAMRRAQEATALYELSQAVGATLSLGRMLNFVADSVLALLHVDKFALFLLDPRADVLEIKIARNIRRETVQGMRPRPGQGIAGWVLEFETPTAVQDVAADHRNRSCPIDGEGVTSLVSVPLQSGDQVIGVLHAMSSRRRLFTVGEMELLYTIANQVGAAIANAQMYEDARQKSEEIRKYVRRVARALGSSLDAQETAQVIADLAAEMTDADRSVLLALNGQGRLAARAACNFKSALAVGFEAQTPDGETPAAWVARRGRSLMIEDLTSDKFALPAFAARERVGGYLGVPLKLGKEVLGVLEVYAREARRFTPDEMRLLITFASQASVALQNAFLVEQAGRRRADLQALSALSAHLGRAQGARELLRDALPLLGDAIQADAGAAVLHGRPEPPILYHRDGVAEDEARQLTHRPPSEDDATLLSIPLTPAPRKAPQGALLFRRQPPFDAHDRQLIATAANLLAACLR
ncbi:MAG: GAF domain-containing protein [Armatimonadetes bacterium]|nr:GAF domain-containing protein [Armatimonadota bacterium]